MYALHQTFFHHFTEKASSDEFTSIKLVHALIGNILFESYCVRSGKGIDGPFRTAGRWRMRVPLISTMSGGYVQYRFHPFASTSSLSAH